MKRVYYILVFVFVFKGYSQEKIAKGTYIYGGSIENMIKGKILIIYPFNDQKSKEEIIKKFKKEKFHAVSWDDLFMPSINYSENEKNKIINENNIETIIVIKHDYTSTYNRVVSGTQVYNNDFALTNSTVVKEVGEVSLTIKIFVKEKGWGHPLAVIKGKSGSLAKNEKGITLKIIGRFLDYIFKYNKANVSSQKYLEKNISKAITEKNYDFYKDRGQIKMSNKEYKQAVLDFNEAISKDSIKGEVYYFRAYCYDMLGEYEKAIIDLGMAIDFNSKNTSLYFHRALIFSKIENHYGAVKDYDSIIRYDDQSQNVIYKMSTVYNNKAYALMNLKKYSEALPLVLQALELDVSEAYIWDTRGELYYYLGEYKKSVIDMNMALSIEENENSYYYRGLSKLALGEKNEGLKDLAKAKNFVK